MRSSVLFAVGLVVALLLPSAFSSNYALSVLVQAGIFVAFALGYDLSVGHVGTVHLAPPAFFGLGAYSAALIGKPLDLPFLVDALVAAAIMVVFALVVAVPSFRLSHVTFAIGTLAFATIAQRVVNNAVDITRGPLCVAGIARPDVGLPGVGSIHISSSRDYYFLLVPIIFVVIAIYRLMTASRIGRAFAAVRDDEVLASSAGVHPLRYKMLAFAVGSGIAGALGAFQAHYLTVVCPTELATDYTISLLIIVFVGGAGSLAGVVAGAVVFTVLPEVMRGLGGLDVTPVHQLIIFGVILLIVVKYAPRGLQSLWSPGLRSRWLRRRGLSAAALTTPDGTDPGGRSE